MSACEVGAAQIDIVAEGLSFPTSLAFDDDGRIYVAESGLPFAGAPGGGRVVRIDRGDRRVILDGLRPPVNGLTVHRGSLYVSESGHPARIGRCDLEGRRWMTLVQGLPGPGNYHANMVVFGPDERMYFSQGAMTNSGIVGHDAFEIGWLRALPHAHDVPGYDVTLADVVVGTPDATGGGRVATGAFAPFGEAHPPGASLRGRAPCSAAVLACDADGGSLEVFAWGLRNAYGLLFTADGRLLATDQGLDDRGSRPIGRAPDLLFEVRRGAWYGWPDFVDAVPITDPRWTPERGPPPRFVLSRHDRLPPPERALLRFPEHASAVKLAEVPASHALWPRHLFVALFGDERPMTGPEGERAGRCLVRVDPSTWELHPVLHAPLHRPIDVRFGPDGALYVLDFGAFEVHRGGRVSGSASGGRVLRIRV